MAERARRPRSAAKTQITERDQVLLSFLAEHRVVETGHVQALLGITAGAADARLRALAAAKLLVREAPFRHRPPCHRITRRGLAAAGSQLPTPTESLHSYAHDVGIAWVWLAAQRGAFGPLSAVISERQLRSHDGRLLQTTGPLGPSSGSTGLNAGGPGSGADRPGSGFGDGAAAGRPQPLAIRLGGYGSGGRERLHYPDLLLVTPEGQRIAVELELSSKGRLRRERILAAYGADRRIDAVLYLAGDRAIGEKLRTSASRLGLSAMIHVQYTRPPGSRGGRTGPVASRASARSLSPTREPAR